MNEKESKKEVLDGVSVVLPSLDPDEKLLAVVVGLLSVGFTDIILVNDGSKQEKLHYFEEAAKYPQVHVLTHPVNQGKGAALKTAFAWFLENRPKGEGVVTVDGDNQHRPEDTLACTEQMLKSRHVVLGVRDFSLPQVPSRSRFGNKVTSGVFKIFCGMRISDTQTGLRAIPASALPSFVKVSGDRFEYETNMLLAIRDEEIPFEEVKCQTVYIEENKSSHFRTFVDSFRIYRLLFAHFFRYTLSSLLSALLDEGVFTALSFLLHGLLNGLLLTAIPAFAARVISSLFNFFMNRNYVFQSKEKTGKSLLRYYALAVPLFFMQLLLTHGVFVLFHVKEESTGLRALIYAIVMTVLYVASFMLQQRFVFRTRQKSREEEKNE